MADQQITQLPEETGTLASTDVLAMVNVTAAETRKITVANLATAVFTNLSTGGLGGSKVGTGINGANLTNGTVTNAKLANDSVSFGGISVDLGAQDLTPAFDLTDATNYKSSNLSGTITNSQLAGSIANNKLVNSSVSYGGIQVSLGSSDDTPAFDLTDATNYKTSNLSGTITNSQLAGSIANGKLVNSSVSFGGVSVSLGSSDATPAFDLQDSTGYKASNLSGTISNNQLAGSIAASKLVANSLTTDQLGPNCVGASELATNAVDTANIQDGKIVNDKIETSTNSSTGLDGSTKLRAGSVPASKLDASTIGNGLAINSNVLSINNTISGATSLGLTFSNQGICTGIAALSSSDLTGVLATASAVGVVKIPSSGGLSVSGSGDLSLASTVTAHTTRGITVNAFGQVTSVSANVPSANLPVASTTAVGGIKVPSTSSPLAVDVNGVLSIGVSGVTAGTGYTKFNVSDKGLVSSAGALAASDIPNISAALLTSGSLDVARIANDSIGREKFSNNSTCIFGSVAQANFPSISDSYRGELFFDTTEEDLYINDGNAWQPVTTLTKGSLKLGGVYSAATSAVTSVTSHGASVGLTIGQNLPTPTSTTDSTYLIVGAGGTPSGIPNGPTGELIPPDYLLSLTSSTGSSWVEIDLSTTVSSPTAANVSVVSGYGGSSTNVQTALTEIYSDFLKLGGGNITGELKIESSGSFAFEGTANAYETRLTVVDPGSADRTITFPDASGTVVLQGQTSVVTSTMVDASLANANIAANAAIALSKLAAVSAGQILVGASGTGAITAVTPTGDIALSSAGAFSYVAGSISNADINASAGISASKIDAASTSQAGCVQLSSAVNSTSATKAATPLAIKTVNDSLTSTTTTANAALPKTGGILTGHITLDNQKELQFREADAGGDHYIALKAAAALAADVTLTLPDDSPSAGYVLKAGSSTPTNLEWAADSATPAGSNTQVQYNNSGAFAGSSNLTFNSGTGALTATTFVGNIDAVDGDFDGTLEADAITVGGTALSSVIANTTVTNATNAAHVSVADNESTNENNLIPFIEDASATGNVGLESDGDFHYNPSTGLLTATGFSGSGASLTHLDLGNANNTGTIATARIPTLNQDTTGSAATLTTARTINGVSFDGSANITVAAAAGTLTGTELKNTVVTSSLTSVGTLTSLTIDGDVTFTGDTSNGLWDKSANQFVANLSGTASIASSVTVADESTDTTCFPLFVDSATGNLAPKSGSNLTFNSATGVLSATSFSGSGANLTNLPASGGSTTGTASGAITAGEGVIVNSSGQFTKITETIATNNPITNLVIEAGQVGERVASNISQAANVAVGDPYQEGGYNGIAYDKANQVIVCAYGYGNTPRLVPGLVKTTGIEWRNDDGGQVDRDSGRESKCVCQTGDNIFVWFWRDGSMPKCQVVKQTTASPVRNTLALAFQGSEVSIAQGLTNDQIDYQGQVVHIGSGKMIFCWYNPQAESIYYAILQVSDNGNGTTITRTHNGSEVDSDGGYYNRLIQHSGGKIILLFQHRGGSDQGYAKYCVGTVGSTSVTWTSKVTLWNHDCEWDSVNLVELSDGRLLSTVQNGSNCEYRIGTLSGTSISWTTATTLSGIGERHEVQTCPTTKLPVFSYRDGTNCYLKFVTISSNTLTLNSTALDLEGWDGTYAYTLFDRRASLHALPDVGQMVSIGRQKANNQTRYQIVSASHVVGTASTDLTANNYVGIATASYTNGQTATVNVVGGVNTAVSGLDPANKYYVQNNGTLSKTETNTVAGLALSATKLLVRG